jgi:hypothetical protein
MDIGKFEGPLFAETHPGADRDGDEPALKCDCFNSAPEGLAP